MVNKQAIIQFLNLINKYVPYLCLPLFFTVALIYVLSSPPAYRVTGQIQLKPSNAAEAIEQFKSPAIVEKAVRTLGLDVKYYEGVSTKQELYGGSVPVKIIFSGSEHVKYNATSSLNVINDHEVQIRHEDTIATYAIGELTENESYGRFKVLKGPAYAENREPVLLTFTKPEEVLDEYRNSLGISLGDNGIVKLSVIAGHPQKGIDLVNKLIAIYNASVTHSLSSATKNNESVAGKISVLKLNLEQLQRQSNRLTKELPALKASMTVVAKPSVTHKLNEQQQNIFKVIEAYLNKPVDQFVQVPYVDEVDNLDIRDKLIVFNETELDKQRRLNKSDIDKNEISAIDLKITSLKKDMLNRIQILKNGATVQRLPGESKFAQLYNLKADSLKSVNSEVTAASKRYALLRSQDLKNLSPMGKSATIISRPEDNVEDVSVNAFLVFALVIVAGLISTVALLLFRNRDHPALQLKGFSQQSLLDRFNTAIRAKQID